MNQTAKKHLAFKIRTREEAQTTNKKTHEEIFDSKGWGARKTAIAARVAKQQGAAHERAVARPAVPKVCILTRARQAIQRGRQARIDARMARHAAYERKNA